jgi:type VI secretion system secreted protein Hcp
MAIYIKADDITGGSTREAYKEQIEASSAQFGAHRAVTFRDGSGGAGGEAALSEITFTKSMDNSSVELLKRVCTGKVIPTTEITWTKSSGDGEVEFYKVKLTDSLISSYSTSASGGLGDNVTPMESFSLAYKKIEFSYTPQNNDGTPGAAIEGNWSVEKAMSE